MNDSEPSFNASGFEEFRLAVEAKGVVGPAVRFAFLFQNFASIVGRAGFVVLRGHVSVAVGFVFSHQRFDGAGEGFLGGLRHRAGL